MNTYKGMITMEDEIVKGYKATNKNMQCRGFQFELGVWHKHDGEIAMCESGFHFCEYPSGPWSFYWEEGTRIFEVEARGVLKGDGTGADLKHVAMEIKLVREVEINGSYNTGRRNAGSYNAGSYNTGHRNAGSYNAGIYNTGNGNTGVRNTGSYNTGSYNTGDGNAGSYNTGSYNAGSYNTGNGNATDRCSGYLCSREQPLVIFDEPADEEMVDFNLVLELCILLSKDAEFDCGPFLCLPNATEDKIKALHGAHISRRAKK